jgi:hypothetical protein
MKAQVRFAIAALGLMSAVGTAPLAFAGLPHEDVAEPAVHQGGGINRTVVIDDKTKYVNVREDEIIRFIVARAGGQKSFAWVFDMQDQNADLRQLAPKGMLVGGGPIRVYVIPTRSSAQ